MAPRPGSDKDTESDTASFESTVEVMAGQADTAVLKKQLESHRGWLTRILKTSASTLAVDPADYSKPVIRDALEKHLHKL